MEYLCFGSLYFSCVFSSYKSTKQMKDELVIKLSKWVSSLNSSLVPDIGLGYLSYVVRSNDSPAVQRLQRVSDRNRPVLITF